MENEHELNNDVWLFDLIQLIKDTLTSQMVCYKCHSTLELIQDGSNDTCYFLCKRCNNRVNHVKFDIYNPIEFLI